MLFAGGTGHPFSTDTAAALRGCEIETDILLFATLMVFMMMIRKKIVLQKNTNKFLANKFYNKILK